MTIPTMQEMLEAGVHFGHKVSRWNPKMAPFIFTERNKIHIFDLSQTVEMLEEACKFLEKIVREGGIVLFVGTKKQASPIVKKEAERALVPYISERWLGGTLTNFETIKKRIRYYKELESRDVEGLTKKEKARVTSERNKLRQVFEGIKDLNNLPNTLFIADVTQEKTAIREAKRLGIPVVALVDTNGDPNLADYVIPGNDDAVGAIKIITQTIADAIINAKTSFDSAQDKQKSAKSQKIEETETKETKEMEVKKVSKAAKVAKVTKAKKVKPETDSKKEKVVKSSKKKIQNPKNKKSKKVTAKSK